MRVFLVIIEMVATYLQVHGGLKEKRDRTKSRFIWGGLALLIAFRGLSYWQDEKVARAALRKDAKLAYQEAVLKKVDEKELNRAALAVRQEEGKLKLLDNMRSEFAETLRQEGEVAALAQPAAKP